MTACAIRSQHCRQRHYSGKDYADETFANNTGKLKAKKIVFAGYGIGDPKYNDYQGKDVKGAIVVIFASEPRQDGNSLITGTRTASPWGFGVAKKQLSHTNRALKPSSSSTPIWIP